MSYVYMINMIFQHLATLHCRGHCARIEDGTRVSDKFIISLIDWYLMIIVPHCINARCNVK